MSVDWSDIGWKALWTGAAASGAYIAEAVATEGAGSWWLPAATAVTTAALAWIRQRAGAGPEGGAPAVRRAERRPHAS